MNQAKQMIQHSTIYAIGNISRQLVGFIMLPIYTNYLSPSDYGVIGLLIFAVSLFEILLGGHMFQAVPKYYHLETKTKDKNTVISTALLVSTITSGFACLLMASSSNQLSVVLFGNDTYSIYIIIFSALILTHALEQYGFTYLRIIKKPWVFFNYSMLKLVFQLSLNILTIVILDWGLIGLAISSLISSVIISILLMTYTIYRTGLSVKKEIAKTIIIFSWPLWISGFIGLYIGSSNRYFIRLFSSLDDVGLYELAAKFGTIVMILVWSPFSQYWQTERYAIAMDKNPYPSYSLAFRLITALLLISGLGISIFSQVVIEIMADPLFHSASTAIPYLVVANVFQSLTIFNNFSFMHTGNTFEVTKNNIVTAICITILYLLFIPYYGFTGAAVAFAVGSIIQYCYALYRGKKLYDLRVSQKPLLASMLILITICLVAYNALPRGFELPTLAFKLLLAILGTLLIIGVSIKRPEIDKLIEIIVKRNLKKT